MLKYIFEILYFNWVFHFVFTPYFMDFIDSWCEIKQ